MDQVKVTFFDRRSSNEGEPVMFSERLDNGDLKSLRQTIACMQTKMNDWLTAEIEKAREANPSECGDGNTPSQTDDVADEDEDLEDDEEEDSEPPAKQKKT